MSTLSTPRFTVLSDHYDGRAVPESIAGTDPFAFHVRLAPIFDILRHKNTDMPLAMALYGDTGTGKTSALSWLVQQTTLWNSMPAQDRDGHPRVLPVWFSARKYDSTDCILREMVSEIILQCLDQLPSADTQKRSERLSDAMETCGPVLGRGFIRRLENKARHWNVRAGLPSATVSVDSDPVHAESGAGMCCDLLMQWLSAGPDNGEQSRIAVFIDDLDHCRRDVVMSAFNAISLHLSFPGIIFVAGISCAVTMTLVAGHYKEHGYGEVQSRRFLSRIFQVEYHIEPSSEQVRNFYDEQVALLNDKTDQIFQTHLTAEFRSCIDTAVLHLAGGNPRKIKLLLNSALMKGCSASHHSMSAGQDAASHLLFAQGIQVYLLQRWFSYFSEGAPVLYRPDVLEWFDALSQDARASGSDYKRMVVSAADKGGGGEGFSAYSSRGTGWQPRRLPPPEGLSFSMIHEWVWNLLKIPFSKNVVIHCAQPVEPVVEQPVEAEEGVLGKASRVLKNALAAALEKSVNELTGADLCRVTSLDLAGQKLSDGDLAVIAGLENLERLDLYNTAVRDIGELNGLRKLKFLNLSCTAVQDISALKSLSLVDTLDLSCSGVEDLTPLAGHPGLESLILYGTSVRVLDALAGLPNLSKLNLSRTAVTNDSLTALETLPSLKSVFLRETAIGRERILALKKTMNFSLQIDS